MQHKRKPKSYVATKVADFSRELLIRLFFILLIMIFLAIAAWFKR